MARAGGTVVERIWDRRVTEDDPPLTSFLAEQLGTAHWFDQRETRRALNWEPKVTLDEGYRRLQALVRTRAVLNERSCSQASWRRWNQR